jgi:hypothetical protein
MVCGCRIRIHRDGWRRRIRSGRGQAGCREGRAGSGWRGFRLGFRGVRHGGRLRRRRGRDPCFERFSGNGFGRLHDRYRFDCGPFQRRFRGRRRKQRWRSRQGAHGRRKVRRPFDQPHGDHLRRWRR